jgi:hypothetical protein
MDTKDTKDTMPRILGSWPAFVPFVPFVSFVSFVWRRWRGERQGHDEAAQGVADRRRHPITLTKTAGSAGRRAGGFCDLTEPEAKVPFSRNPL